jgi:phosphoesterase RecJ-like protein
MQKERFTGPLPGEVGQYLSQPRNIVITTHYRPDGDAMGSSLGLYNYLVQKGHSVQVITPNAYPDFLKWLPGNDHVMQFESDPEAAARRIGEAELVFCLDFNHLDRLETMASAVREASAKRILIDHHLDPEPVFTYPFSYPSACSTCELVFQFIEALGDLSLIHQPVAECLYTGIMTDTQQFRLPTVTPLVHAVVAHLMRAGAQNYRIYERVYESNTADRLRLLGYCLKDKLVVLPEFRSAYIALSQAEMDAYHFRPGDTEGVVNYALSVEGTVMAAFFSERDGVIKISFRSRAGFSVKDLASGHFEGGGHRNASGGQSRLSLEATVRKFLDLLPDYRDELLRQE